MHLTKRRIIFYSLVLLFFVAGSYAVASALGFAITAREGVLRTGSLFLASIPRDATITIDGTPAKETPGLLSGGTLIKNLFPASYEVRVEHPGRTPWHAILPISAGLVTRATDIFLWPRTASATPVAAGIESFALSAGIPLLRTARGILTLDGMRMPGSEVVFASNDTATLITRAGEEVYLAPTGGRNAAVNLTSLFQSLKERELRLPGKVPIVEVRPHPFSRGKILITSKTSLYSLDVNRVSLERLAGVSEIAATAWSDSEVLLLDANGSLTAVDLVFRTVQTVPFTSSTVHRLASAAEGRVIISLTAEGELAAYERATGARTVIAEGVRAFAVSPGGDRIAYARGDAIAVYFLERYEGDTIVPKGHTLSLAGGYAAPRDLTWEAPFSRYVFFLSDGELIAAEVGFYGEQNHTVLARNVRSFAIDGFSAYLLGEDGALALVSFEE